MLIHSLKPLSDAISLVTIAYHRDFGVGRFDAHNETSSFRKPFNVLNVRSPEHRFFVKSRVWFTLKAIRVDDLYDAAAKSVEARGIGSDGRVCRGPAAAATAFPRTSQ
jgi:hypothetical protein